MNAIINTENFTLYIGSTSEHIMMRAKEHDPDAYLIDVNNLHDTHQGVAYTSLGDIVDSDQLTEIMDRATTVIYDPPPEWVDPTEKSEQWETEKHLCLAKLHRYDQIQLPDNISSKHWETITNDEAGTMLELKDVRKVDGPQLWIAGCSFTYGVGLTDIDQRYGNILSDQLEMPASFLAWPASNIPWAADQILRSDIREGDIVVWGLTQWTRITHYDRKKNQLAYIHAGYYDWFPKMQYEVPPDMLDHPSRLYESMRAIHATVNFCDKIGAKLLLAGLFNGAELGEYLNGHFDNYIYFKTSLGSKYYPDQAPNDLHPGPITHQMYADGIMEKMRELGYI